MKDPKASSSNGGKTPTSISSAKEAAFTYEDLLKKQFKTLKYPQEYLDWSQKYTFTWLDEKAELVYPIIHLTICPDCGALSDPRLHTPQDCILFLKSQIELLKEELQTKTQKTKAAPKTKKPAPQPRGRRFRFSNHE